MKAAQGHIIVHRKPKDGTNGKDGKDSVSYWLVPSVTQIKKNKEGVLTPSSITCVRMKKQGDSAAVETTEGLLSYRTTSSPKTYTGAIDIPSNCETVSFVWAVGGVVVDRKTVDVISDGFDSVSIMITTQTLVWDLREARQIIGIDLYEGDKSVLYGIGKGGFECSTVTPPTGLKCTYDGIGHFGHTFSYVYNKDANAIINTEIPYTITYKGKTYYYIAKMQTVENGLDGCIQRLTEWHEGVEYHNDKNLKTPIRFLDSCIVYNDDRTVMGYYVCRKTHVATALNKPIIGSPDTAAWHQFWTEVNETAPIYTPLIISDYAMLRFTQTNQLLVMDNNKSIIAGMGGGDYPIWVGGETPTSPNTKTRISKSGAIEAEEGLFRGFVQKKKTVINGTNFKRYAYLDPDFPIDYNFYVLNFTTAGSYVVFEGNLSAYKGAQLRFYGYRVINNNFNINAFQKAVEYIGCKIIICCMTDNTPVITGDTALNDGTFVSIPTQKSNMYILECKIRPSTTSSRYFDVYWNCTKYQL